MSEDQSTTLSHQLPEDLTDAPSGAAKVSVVFGSASDWPTMRATVEVLDTFGVACEYGVVSAHRTPDRLREFAEGARGRGVEVIIAAAGGAAHLPGMIAAWTTLPVLGVPIRSRALSGVDSLLSIVQMPRGVPVGTLAIGDAGASNAALLALRMLSTHDAGIEQRLKAHGDTAAASALSAPLD